MALLKINPKNKISRKFVINRMISIGILKFSAISVCQNEELSKMTILPRPKHWSQACPRFWVATVIYAHTAVTVH